MRKFFYPAAGKPITDSSLAARIPSRLARRSFLIVAGIAVAGGLLNPAYANGCEKLRRELRAAENKKAEAVDTARQIEKKYGEHAMPPKIFKAYTQAAADVAKYEKKIRQIQAEMGEIEMCKF
jgi:hypothetical protein